MKAKILWFTNHVVSFDIENKDELKRNSGRGWVAALEHALRDYTEFELAIAFPDNSISSIQKLEYENRVIYKIPFPDSKLSRWKNRLLGKLEGDDIIQKHLDVVKDYNPDLIHIYGTENSFGEIINKIDTPVILDLQGILSSIVLKWYSSISKFESFIYSSLFAMINIKTHYHDFKIKVKRGEREKKILSTAKYITGRTHWDKNIAKTLAPHAHYMKCNRVIKDDYWRVNWIYPENQEIELLSIMNEDFYKGLDVVYKTASLLKKNGIKFNWKIVGINQKSDYVKIVTKKVGIRPELLNIEFSGKKNSGEIAGLLCNTNFFIHASYIENSPNSVCEAMVCGTPVIATQVGGVASFIKENESGWMIQEGDYTMLAGLIANLIENKNKVIDVAKEGQKQARIRHNKDEILNHTINNYRYVLEKEKTT